MITEVPDRSAAWLNLDAQSFTARKDGLAEAIGDVELRRADQTISTEYMNYDPATRTVTAPGPVVYEDAMIRVEAERAEYSFEDGEGQFNAVNFKLIGGSANGSADDIRLDTEHRSHMHNLQFTTCSGDDPEWQLLAREVELRHEEGIGIARNARLELLNVPVLYLPWISFPIDDRRKSGFLYPHASNANDNGFEVGIPYYWNIAPNQDATLTPRYFTDRGFMLTGEYRMLTRRSGGRLNFDFLSNDKKTRENRYHYQVRHDAAFNPRWRSRVLVDRVSDDQYFQDFGLSLAQTARQYLRSSASLDGAGRYWTFRLLADDFQVIDESVAEAREPYRRLPKVDFLLDRPLGRTGLQFVLDSELVYFDRDAGVTGVRADLYPRVAWNLERYWGFLRPSLGYRYTAYDLERQDASDPRRPDRGTGIFSVDSGLFFQRFREDGAMQTLEPRVFYLYVPFERQDDLPDFDTAELTFGFSQLFHYNRFTGADRQGDANQLTLALTTRTLDPNFGNERWSFSVGQIFYFDDQQVFLRDEPAVDLDTSPIVAEFTWQPLAQLTTRLGAQWNWENRELDVGALGLDYQSERGSRLGFEYRFRRDRLDQFDVRHLWQVDDRWRVMSRLKYSLDDSDLLEALAGVEYESCCWGIRLVARRYLRSREGDERDAIYLEFSLKGLGSFGRRPQPMFYDEAE